MDNLVLYLQNRFPFITYRQGATFCWSPETNEVMYVKKTDDKHALWSLLHETSHGILGHRSYNSDVELVRLEVAAWEKAKELAGETNIKIDEDHVQDCLDTYRDWLYTRSICPKCNNKSLQQGDLRHYRCYNCHNIWRVTPSRFCRPYRASKHMGATSSRLEAFARIT